MLKKVLLGGLILLLLLLAFAVAATFKLASDSRSMTVEVGLANGRLSDCPASPNCVSSDAAPGDSHYIAAIQDPTGAKWASLVERIGAMDGATLVTADDVYAHFTFTTRIMGFVDDVEFAYRPESRQIAVRSASRVGQGDMNVNRNRVESIRAAL